MRNQSANPDALRTRNDPDRDPVRELGRDPVREPAEPPAGPALHARGRLITTVPVAPELAHDAGPPAGSAPVSWPLPPGLHYLGALGSPDSVIHVPAGCSPENPFPLALLLHGAGARPEHTLSLLEDAQRDAVVVAPKAHGGTWDLIGGGYGDDVALIDRLLAWTFQRVAVDTQRIVIGGFSDGASYALSLGLANPQLFTHVLAYSPGYVLRVPQESAQRARVFISHGREDQVLPVASCSGRIVPALRAGGYEVRYVEFVGGHEVPLQVRRQGVKWVREG